MRALVSNCDPITLAPTPSTPRCDSDEAHRLNVQPSWMQLEDRGFGVLLEGPVEPKELTGCVEGRAVRNYKPWHGVSLP